MKTMKYLLIAVTLVSSLSICAQENATIANFQKGDTIVIKQDHNTYLTGETMSRWIYLQEHTILKVGGKRFPNGILIAGIFSWVSPDAIVNKSTHLQEAIQEQEAKLQAEREQARQDSLTQALEESIRIAKEQARQDSIAKAKAAEEAAKVEQARQDSIAKAEQARQDSIAAAEAARQDSIAAAEAEQALQDSIARAIPHNCNRLTLGIRGGAASLLHQTDNQGTWNVGFDALFDLQYAHYWKKATGKPQLGLLLGVSAGYSRSHLSGAVNDEYSITDNDGNQIDYSISTSDVKEYDGQIQIEVPLMFSLITEKGFFFNIGPRFVLPVYTHYNQNLVDPNIDAYFVTEGVHVPNEYITGKITEDKQNTTGKWEASTLNIFVSAELGYEWTFKNMHSLGLGVYANYSAYTLYKHDASNLSIVNVTAPTEAQPAQVTINSETDAYDTGLGYFDAGIKLAYHFNFWK